MVNSHTHYTDTYKSYILASYTSIHNAAHLDLLLASSPAEVSKLDAFGFSILFHVHVHVQARTTEYTRTQAYPLIAMRLYFSEVLPL